MCTSPKSLQPPNVDNSDQLVLTPQLHHCSNVHHISVGIKTSDTRSDHWNKQNCLMELLDIRAEMLKDGLHFYYLL